MPAEIWFETNAARTHFQNKTSKEVNWSPMDERDWKRNRLLIPFVFASLLAANCLLCPDLGNPNIEKLSLNESWI